MLKRLTLLAMSVGALAAFAVPATSGAAVLKNGSTTVTSGPIEVTGPTLKTTTSLGTIECKSVTLFGEISRVSESLTEGYGTGGFASGCTLQPGERPATVYGIQIGFFESFGPFMAAEFRFTAEMLIGLSTIACEFATVGPSSLVVTTGTDTAHVAIPLTSEVCGEAELHGETTWETAGGAPLTFAEG